MGGTESSLQGDASSMIGRSWTWVLGWLLLGGTCVLGQDDPGVSYVRKQRFPIPFNITPGDEQRVREVRLSVSEDQGRSWRFYRSVLPQDKYFDFSCQRDGMYWFIVQTLHTDGTLLPPHLDNVPAGLKVVVDTQPPQITLRPIPTQGDQVGVEWDIREEYLDRGSILLEARPPQGEWQTISIEPQPYGRRTWNWTGRGQLEVRLRARDQAGNQNSAFTQVTGSGTGTGSGSFDAPRNDPNFGQRQPPRQPSGSGVGSGSPEPSSNTVYVNHTDINVRFALEDVGPSGAVVELYYTKGGGRWEKYREPQTFRESSQREASFRATLPGEGAYGVSLSIKSGVGYGDPPPRPGEAPQIWVVIDLTKPQVKMGKVQAQRTADGGVLTIQWTAHDTYLDGQPITLLYADELKNSWQPIARNIDNQGQYTWRLPPEVPPRIYVKVEARDKAGNVGFAETDQPVIVDLSQPRGRLIGVDPAGPSTSGGSSSNLPSIDP